MLRSFRVPFLLDTTKTIAHKILKGVTYPWEALPLIQKFILDLGNSLPREKYVFYKENIWIAKNAKVSDIASIVGPAIIDEEAQIRPGSYIRANVIVGKKVVVGNSTEIKNSILFDETKAPHYNYIGDSILGHKSHLGAGVILSNLKSDKRSISIKVANGSKIETGLKKLGAIVGDSAEVGCNSVLNPGAILARDCTIYPLCSVRGYVPESCIFKGDGNLVEKF